MILLIPIIFVLVCAWFAYGFPQLVTFTKIAADWCQSIFLQCLEYLLIAKVFFLWFGFSVLVVWFVYAVLKAAFVLFRTHRQTKALPFSDYGDIIVIKDDKLKTAFTHGLLHPKIYISKGLINSLDNFELTAVYLHEMHHKKRKDPLRFFILSILRDTFFYVPISKFIAGFVHDKIETAADNAVVAEMKEPISLAGALLKIACFNKDMVVAQSVSISGFGSTERRIRKLIEGSSESTKLPAMKAIIVSGFMSGLLIFSLAFPLFSSFPDLGRCDTSHCAMHMNKLGKDCQSHCEVSKHTH